MKLNRVTPVLVVDSIERCLPFWIDRLGFTKTVEVPHGDHLGFVILVAGACELMLQSRASVKDDVPAFAEGEHRAMLFLEVPDLADIQRRLGDWPRVVPERDTFYGTRETAVRDPAGNGIVFAERLSPPS